MSQSLVSAACQALDKNQKLLWGIYKFKRALDAGEYVLNKGREDEVDARDLLWQNQQDQFDQMGSAHLAWQIWIGIITHPKAISASILVGSVPLPDRAIAANNKILSKLTYPFTANFKGGTQGPDGQVLVKKEGRDKGLPNAAPLEVGSVHPSTLYFRAWQNGCFARWPYGSKFIYLFKASNPPSISGFDTLISSHLKECLECNSRQVTN